MLFRCSNSVLIRLQHRIAFIILLTFIGGSQNLSAQQQIAQDAYAIFQQSCLICHGPDGAYKETLLMEHNALIEKGTVVPGNPDASELYNRLLTTDTAKRMPLGQPQLSAQAIDTIRNWILAGAPDWTTVATTNGNFISPSEILNTIETHLTSLSSFDRAFARYFTMTHLYNAGETAQVLDAYRNGLSKLVNSLSWKATVTNPQPIDPQETIFYIDLRHYEWDRNDGWPQIEGAYPYHIAFEGQTQTVLHDQLGRLQMEMKSNIPSIHVDWFLATAASPPLYHELLSLPLTDRELETRLDVDVVRNLRDAPGIDVWRAGFNNSGVSNNNRMVERHASQHGAYWKSYDFAGSVGTQNIFNHPLDFAHDGGEVIFNLPNGLQGYYLVNASGSRLDAAPINIVSNPAASDPTVRNGISCFGCHTEGMKTFEDEVRAVIESNATPVYDKAQALRLYVAQSEMDALLQEDTDRYKEALEATGGEFGGIEPISRFHEVFQGTVDAAYAAAVVGLETETFLEKIRENVGLQNAGLLVLDSPNGSMKRDAWTDSFGDIIFALDFPESFTPPTDTTPTTPGAVVRIPDPNLRAVIAEALGKSPNAPITVEEMKRLTHFEAKNKGIQDLTGIQFATNLNHLSIRVNQISDLSPIAQLTKLREIQIDRNPIFNSISHIRDLKNLRHITLTQANISNISALANLTNLISIHGWGNPISDLSPITNLDKLEHIYLPVSHISDITPLSNLTKLKELFLHDCDISDISTLANLTKLEHLTLYGNNISDISPLTNLTNLKTVGIRHNNISDISPLMHRDIIFTWDENPGFPQHGPNIEGPWLWLILPNQEFNINLDPIQKASKGKLTETKIAATGAIEGDSIKEQVWTAHKLSPENENRPSTVVLKQKTKNAIIYGIVFIHSPHKQDTTIFANNNEGLKVYLNKEKIYEQKPVWKAGGAHKTFFPVTLVKGKNILMVAVQDNDDDRLHFSFKPGTEYTAANPGVGYAFSPTPIHVGDTFTLDIGARDVFDLAGWQFDIAFDPAALEAINVTEGNFLKTGGTTFFQGGTIDNASGKITGLSAIRLSDPGVSGTGPLLQIQFKAKSAGETELALQNFQFGAITGEPFPAGPHEVRIVVEGQLATGDVNRDGQVSILDLILIARQLGKRVPANSPVDLNRDGVVSILDLILAAQSLGKTTAPAAPAIEAAGMDPAMIETWIAQARLEDDGSLAFKQGVENLQNLLASLIPEETALLANYPNPFNPETWIPYQLAKSAEVTLTIYDMNGGLVRRLALGHQAAGMYRNRSCAAYWNGRNQLGESVASGLYFYTLTAGDFTATRRMLILK